MPFDIYCNYDSRRVSMKKKTKDWSVQLPRK